MSGITSLLSMGAGALRANQAALQVTGNNISNVDTEGYSRQSVVLKDGQVVTRAEELQSGDEIDIRFFKSRKEARVI